jgi:glutathione S-transferase
MLPVLESSLRDRGKDRMGGRGALSFLSTLSDGRLYLCGDRLTSADLAFASMPAAVVFPREYGVPLPTAADLSDVAAAEHARWRGHAAGRFALRLYREHRQATVTRGRGADSTDGRRQRPSQSPGLLG